METAGYSGTPLERKLGARDGLVVLLDGAPDGFTLAVPVVRRLPRTMDLTLTFHTRRASLARRLPALLARTSTAGAVWVCWPKQAAVKRLGLDSDLGEADVREAGLGAGWVDVKIVAVDEVWSGLKLVRRLRDR